MEEVGEEEEASSLFYENHPLENDVVLETLAKYVRRRDLLRCRQVCKKWNSAVLSRVRSEFRVRLDEASLGRYSSLSQFLSLVLSSDPLPFGSFLLLNLKLGNPLLEKVFTICGHLIKSVRIELGEFDILDVFGLRELMVYRAPNIQSLSIEGCLPEEVISFPRLWATVSGCKCEDVRPILPKLKELRVEGRKMHPRFLVDFLRSCPNIQGIKSNKNWGLEKSSMVIKALDESGNWKHINSLHLHHIDGEMMRMLLRMEGVRLKELSFKILDGVDSPSLQRLMERNCDSLRDLSLGEVGGRRENLVISFPRMKNLRRLVRQAVCKPEIILNSGPNYNNQNDHEGGGGFCFALLTPNLEDLDVQAFADELRWNDYFSDVNILYPSNSLRILNLPTNLCDTSKLDKLGRMFPNVREVTARCPRNPVIAQLWSMWPDLQELTLYLSEKNERVDSVFTGIPENLCDLINLSRSFDEVDLETVRVGPSIANLRELRKLHIDVETSPTFWSETFFFCDHHQEATCFLSNITARFGLAFLQNLEDVSISCCEITDDCCHDLAKNFQKFAKIFISARNHVPVYEYDELQ